MMVIMLPVIEEVFLVKGLKVQKSLLPLSYTIILGSQLSLVSNPVNLYAFKGVLATYTYH